MTKKILIVCVLMLSFSLVTGSALAQGKANGNNSPFLISGKLPHLTKLLMQQWDNPDLQLTEEQRTQLLVVRKETIGGVRSFGKDIGALEQQVVEGSLAGKSPEELRDLVEKIEKLKGAATMLHLSCIYKTSKILDQKQLAVLKK